MCSLVMYVIWSRFMPFQVQQVIFFYLYFFILHDLAVEIVFL